MARRIFAKCGVRVASWNKLRSHACNCNACAEIERDRLMREALKDDPSLTDTDLVDLVNEAAKHSGRYRLHND